MRFVTPKVFLVAKSVPSDDDIAQWLREIGCDDTTVSRYASSGGSTVKSSGERITELAGRRCYKSFQVGLNPNVTRIREEIRDYIDNILASGHGSVLEHTYFTFAIENVSRVFTGEMNRHRAGVAISEGSMRYIRYSDIPIVETPMLTLADADIDDDLRAYFASGLDDDISKLKSLAYKKQRTRDIIRAVVNVIEKAYTELQILWADELSEKSSFKWKKHLTSLLRRIVPMGVATGGVWTANIRALRHICTMRCSEAAEEEIALVAGLMLAIMMEEEPLLFGDFTKNEQGFWGPKYHKV